MKTEPDGDLRTRFAALRSVDHELAPAWNPQVLQVAPKAASWSLPYWLPITATACLLLGFTFTKHDSARPSENLSAMLPEFFATQGEPLFASLIAAPSTPSDSLLPAHLTIYLP